MPIWRPPLQIPVRPVKTPIGWTHIAKVNGVLAAAIAKVNGVAVATIAKIKGTTV